MAQFTTKWRSSSSFSHSSQLRRIYTIAKSQTHIKVQVNLHKSAFYWCHLPTIRVRNKCVYVRLCMQVPSPYIYLLFLEIVILLLNEMKINLANVLCLYLCRIRGYVLHKIFIYVLKYALMLIFFWIFQFVSTTQWHQIQIWNTFQLWK